MDWLTFCAAVIGALAWPTATVFAVLLLRRPVVSMILLLRRLRYGDLEMEFSSDLEKAQKVIKEKTDMLQPLGVTGESTGIGLELDHLEELAVVSPRAAVVEAWRQLEEMAHHAAEAKQPIDETKKLSPRAYRKILVQHGILDSKLGGVFDLLRELRNRAAHRPDLPLSSSESLEYLELVEFLMGRIADGTPQE